MEGMKEYGDDIGACETVSPDDCPENRNPRVGGRKTQWATNDDNIFYAVGRTDDTLKPGAYEIVDHRGDIFFRSFPVESIGLIEAHNTVAHQVVDEAVQFWGKCDRFSRFKLAHRRGALIYGPAGCGKSSALKLVARDVINRGGVIIPFRNPPQIFVAGLTLFRQIQPDTPIVVPMEDLEAILDNTDESYFLNLLDGGYSHIKKVMWLATTNHPQALERRITNRPSRFDCVFEMTHPDANVRKLALENHLTDATPDEAAKFDIERAVRDSEGLSFASLKELFTSVVVFERSYDDTIARLKAMADDDLPSGDELEFAGRRGDMGFSTMNGSMPKASRRRRR